MKQLNLKRLLSITLYLLSFSGCIGQKKIVIIDSGTNRNITTGSYNIIFERGFNGRLVCEELSFADSIFENKSVNLSKVFRVDCGKSYLFKYCEANKIIDILIQGGKCSPYILIVNHPKRIEIEYLQIFENRE